MARNATDRDPSLYLELDRRQWRELRESMPLVLNEDELAELVREQGAVLHSMADGVLAVDADGIVRVVNDRARALLDIDAPVGTPADDLGLTAPADLAAKQAGLFDEGE